MISKIEDGLFTLLGGSERWGLVQSSQRWEGDRILG